MCSTPGTSPKPVFFNTTLLYDLSLRCNLCAICVRGAIIVILYVNGHNPIAMPVFRLGPQQTHMSIMPVVPRCAADASKRPAVSASLRLVLSFCVPHRVPPLSPPAGTSRKRSTGSARTRDVDVHCCPRPRAASAAGGGDRWHAEVCCCGYVHLGSAGDC